MHFDVFNGDADGIIALVQLRLAYPKKSSLITGVKRDINLVERVPKAEASSVTVLDISMEKNNVALNALIDHRIDVFYVDHHRSGEIPDSNFLKSIIDTDANTCTSLLVNTYLSGRYENWAIAAAYGDNMIDSANKLAKQRQLSTQQMLQLKALGTYINYNGYGESVSDLHFSPEALYLQLVQYEDPLLLLEDDNSVYYQLEQAYQQDMKKASMARVISNTSRCKAIELPDEVWASRVSGVLGNDLANQTPDKAHIVFTLNTDKSYTVSLRAPLLDKQGAGDICSQFPTGGGRAAAAGVNKLPNDMIETFIKAVEVYYS